MDQRAAGVLGGLAGGLAISLAMIAGRRTGLMHETLDKLSEDWLDRIASTRAIIGRGGTTALEQTNHALASAAFGYIYGLLRERFPGLAPGLLGGLYGTGLYLLNIVTIAPLLGMTEGEWNTSERVRCEHLGVHIVYGCVTAVVADAVGPGRKSA